MASSSNNRVASVFCMANRSIPLEAGSCGTDSGGPEPRAGVVWPVISCKFILCSGCLISFRAMRAIQGIFRPIVIDHPTKRSGP